MRHVTIEAWSRMNERGIISRIVSYILLVTSIISSVLAQCPPDAMNRVQYCVTLILPDIGVRPSSNHPAPNPLLEVQKACQTDELMATAKCIGDIVSNCQGTTDNEQILQRLVDKDKIVETIQFFCNNLGVYKSNAGCIKRQHYLVEECSRDAKDNYRNKIKLGASIEVLLTATCRFQTTAISCLTETVERKCGDEAAAFVQRIADGQEPPICSQEDDENPRYNPRYNPDSRHRNNSAETNSSKVIFLLCLMLLATVFHMYS